MCYHPLLKAFQKIELTRSRPHPHSMQPLWGNPYGSVAASEKCSSLHGGTRKLPRNRQGPYSQAQAPPVSVPLCVSGRRDVSICGALGRVRLRCGPVVWPSVRTLLTLYDTSPGRVDALCLHSSLRHRGDQPSIQALGLDVVSPQLCPLLEVLKSMPLYLSQPCFLIS